MSEYLRMHMEVIPYNRPLITGREDVFIRQVMEEGLFAGRNAFSKRCEAWFEAQLGGKAFATSSCSQAFDLLASVIDYSARYEVLLPSFTYPTVASAFVRAGATVRFIDSQDKRPHLDVHDLEAKITAHTAAVVVNHYAGQACELDRILDLKARYGFLLVEDCAHAIGASYNSRPLGSYGDFSAFSFHETKNVHCGEGGMLVVRDQTLTEKVSTAWCEGTNRMVFERGDVPHYEWIRPGSSYQPPELSMAFLWGQIEALESITAERLRLWRHYARELEQLRHQHHIYFPDPGAGHNAHIFYLRCERAGEARTLLAQLNARGVNAVRHYQPLHNSGYWQSLGNTEEHVCSLEWAKEIIRLPLFVGLSNTQLKRIQAEILNFFGK